nr:hypothetical protein [Tanacetum cinerariifolium]
QKKASTEPQFRVMAFVQGLVEACGLEDGQGLVQARQGLVHDGQGLEGHVVVGQPDGTRDSFLGSSVELLMKKSKTISKKNIQKLKTKERTTAK